MKMKIIFQKGDLKGIGVEKLRFYFIQDNIIQITPNISIKKICYILHNELLYCDYKVSLQIPWSKLNLLEESVNNIINICKLNPQLGRDILIKHVKNENYESLH